jgi:outer membrane lipoprotein SlyB
MRAIVLSCLLLIATPVFAVNPTGRVYDRQEALTAQEVRVARVLHIRHVDIASNKRTAGTAIGAAVGYAAGSKAKSNRNAARTVGTILGGAAGNAIQGANKRPGLEILVQESSGRTWAIVQDADVPVAQGDLVALVGKGKKIRVVPLTH